MVKYNRLYDDLAYLWPWVSVPEDYAEEASYWRAALRAKLGPGRHTLLELGVGGGNNLSHLSREFQATAVDLSEGMMAHSRQLNPEVDHFVGDMRSVRLGRTFKAVIIHDAIDYLLAEDDLRATFKTAAAHLEAGGILVIAPDWYRETFPDPYVSHSTTVKDGIELTFIEYEYDPDPSDTTVETVMLYMIREGGKLRIEEDHHINGIFPLQTWIDLMQAEGFSVEKFPYPVHQDGHEAYLLVGTLG
ncbi:MAG: class I SAM-dependent methyltransferase [Chloroflexi bacterium]|nr:class I SAM-dependent methyltransferase [Chloroflexota bacterium]